jgi:hypothetical protein
MSASGISFKECQDALAECENQVEKARELLKNENRVVKPTSEVSSGFRGLFYSPTSDIQVNLQTAEVYFSNRMLAPIHYEVAGNSTFKDIFKNDTVYAAVSENKQNRKTLRIQYKGSFTFCFRRVTFFL